MIDRHRWYTGNAYCAKPVPIAIVTEARHSSSGIKSGSVSSNDAHLAVSGPMSSSMYCGWFSAGPTLSASVPTAS